MPFCDETNHFARNLDCGWGARTESAEEVALRLRRTACDIRRIEPALSPVWPAFSSRAIRPSDPGPVDELPVEDLGRLIDRRARCDPPQLPAPVGPTGYDLTLAGLPSVERRWRLDPHLRAGSVAPELPNGWYLRPNLDCPVWEDADRGVALLRSLVRAWEPDWALASASIQRPPDDRDGRVSWPCRPWLAWRKNGGPPVPYEFLDIGEPSVVRAELGGELRIWP